MLQLLFLNRFTFERKFMKVSFCKSSFFILKARLKASVTVNIPFNPPSNLLNLAVSKLKTYLFVWLNPINVIFFGWIVTTFLGSKQLFFSFLSITQLAFRL
jgi:hypothetical protein